MRTAQPEKESIYSNCIPAATFLFFIVHHIIIIALISYVPSELKINMNIEEMMGKVYLSDQLIRPMSFAEKLA